MTFQISQADHCAIEFFINVQIRVREEIRLDPSDKGKDVILS